MNAEAARALQPAFFGIKLRAGAPTGDADAFQGGKYVYHGSYGCTFSPPLAYEGPADAHQPEQPKIGKIMQYANAAVEYEQLKRLIAVDPAQQYGIYADMPPVHVIQAEAAASAGGASQLEKCRTVEAVASLILNTEAGVPLERQAYQLIMTRALGDAQNTLEPLTHKPMTLARVHAHMHALRNLYAGLQHMHANRVCHLDVKPLNCVVVGASAEAPSAYKFIDFGLARSYAELEAGVPDTTVLSESYVYYPLLANVVWQGYGVGEPRADGEFEREVFEDDPFQKRSASPRVARLYAQLIAQLGRSKAREDKPGWAPRFSTFSVVLADFDALLRTYGGQPFGSDARLAAARATDVFGVALVTACVYACLANVVFTEVAVDPKVRGDPLKLSPVSEELHHLLLDMMHMRVRDDAILERYDRVLVLLDAVVATNPSTPLILAALHGRLPEVNQLLAAGARVDAAAEDGSTALMHAAYGGHLDVVKRLVLAGAGVNTMSNDFVTTPLLMAATNGHADVAAALLAAGAEARSNTLIMAATHGHASVVAALLAAGVSANVVASARDGTTPLMAASKGGHLAVVKALIAAGARVSAAGSYPAGQWTSLLLAAQFGHADVSNALIAADPSSVNAQNAYGWTPLMFAVMADSRDLVAALLAAGANVNAANDATWTPLALAVQGGRAGVVQALLAAGANVNAVVKPGKWTPLMFAVQSGRLGAVEALLAAGARVHAVNEAGWTAYTMAASRPADTADKAAILAALSAAPPGGAAEDEEEELGEPWTEPLEPLDDEE
jgi:ankyrin repeat protein/tRNA A-37 threonylcarbamoyl transferase component Bud32